MCLSKVDRILDLNKDEIKVWKKFCISRDSKVIFTSSVFEVAYIESDRWYDADENSIHSMIRADDGAYYPNGFHGWKTKIGLGEDSIFDEFHMVLMAR